MKKLLYTLVIIIMVIAIPLTVYLGMRNQELRKKAAPATNVSLSPASVTKNINDEFTLEVRIDTADNQVVATEINLIYDPTKLEATSITNGTLFPNILSSGTIGNGTASIAVGASNTTTPVHGTGTAALVKFKALAATTSPASVRFDANTYVGALGEGSTNVLIGSSPASVTITGASNNNTVLPTATPTTTQGGNSAITPTATPLITGTPMPTLAGGAQSTTVTITAPLLNESVTTTTPTIEGTAPIGSIVTIVIHSDEQITVTVTADANGNWSYTVPQPLTSGPHTIVVAANNPQTNLTNTATLAFVIASGSENGASGSATPVTGNVEITMLLLAIGALFIVTGSMAPRLFKQQL